MKVRIGFRFAVLLLIAFIAGCGSSGSGGGSTISTPTTTDVLTPPGTAAQETTDSTAPAAPGGLAATVKSATQIDLAWTASTDDVGVTAYEVWPRARPILIL